MKKIVLALLLIGCNTPVLKPNQTTNTPPSTDIPIEGGVISQNDSGERDDIPDSGTDSPYDNGETDNGCGGPWSPKCIEGQKCLLDRDCTVACNTDHICISTPSCKPHFGGSTCGKGEVGTAGTIHESCCKSLEVKGFSDPDHVGKTVYLDKYEITAGRIRAFIAEVTRQMGRPDVQLWIKANTPLVWDASWSVYLPSDVEGGTIIINRLLLGDPRHDGQTPEQAGPGVIIPPTTDQTVSLGLNRQFGGQVFADVHGNNCGTFAGAYGFPTYWYPAATMTKNGEVPRSVTQDLLDVKAMNCITNAMLAAFCAWDGGQLATDEVLDYVTGSPERSESVSGCGSQYDNHGELLGNIFTNTVQSGGLCPDVSVINATFDAGDKLPVPGSFLNKHLYSFPDIGAGTSDKVWQIAAPGRVIADNIDGWMDLAGNLSEAVINRSLGRFGLKGRGIGYGSARSDLNTSLMPGESIVRLQRPEVKSALSGGRCMRFK